MQKTLYTAKVSIHGGRDGHAKASDGQLDTKLAFPTSLGGDGRGSNPEQLFAAGYGACFASTIALIARTSGTALKSVDVDAEVDMLEDSGVYDLAVRLTIRATGQERAVIEQIVEKTKQACPYSRATRGTIATAVVIA